MTTDRQRKRTTGPGVGFEVDAITCSIRSSGQLEGFYVDAVLLMVLKTVGRTGAERYVLAGVPALPENESLDSDLLYTSEYMVNPSPISVQNVYRSSRVFNPRKVHVPAVVRDVPREVRSVSNGLADLEDAILDPVLAAPLLLELLHHAAAPHGELRGIAGVGGRSSVQVEAAM